MSLFKNIFTSAGNAWNRLREKMHADRASRADLLLVHQVVTRRRFPSPSQWRHAGRVLTVRERHILRSAILCLALGALIIIGRWALLHAERVPATGGEYREGIVGTPRAVHPVLATGNDVDQDLVRLVYSGLYRRDSESRLTFDLADSVDISPDGKTYTFKLRDARFHDDTPVTAEDVAFTITTIQNPTWKSPLARNFRGVVASAPDSKTVVINLSAPSSYLPTLLTVGIIPKHIWENIDPASLALSDATLKPIGSGPFKFEKFTRDRQGTILSYTLRATKESGALLDRITFKFFNDYETAVDKLASNAVDGLNFVPSRSVVTVSKIPTLTMRRPALSQYNALFLNPRSQPAFADPTIREALALAIDRERIVSDALGGHAVTRDMPLPEGSAGSTTALTHYAYDALSAAALLNKAGYVFAEGASVRSKSTTTKPATKKEKAVTSSTELALELTVVDSEENRRVAEIIKENWEAVGATVRIKTVVPDDIQKNVVKTRNYQALLFGEILSSDTDPFIFWHSSQITDGLNLSFYNNRRVDELLEKARAAVSDTERGTFLAEFQQIVTRETAAIFLYQPSYAYPQSDVLKGFSVQRMTAPADRFTNVLEWYRKTRITFK